MDTCKDIGDYKVMPFTSTCKSYNLTCIILAFNISFSINCEILFRGDVGFRDLVRELM